MMSKGEEDLEDEDQVKNYGEIFADPDDLLVAAASDTIRIFQTEGTPYLTSRCSSISDLTAASHVASPTAVRTPLTQVPHAKPIRLETVNAAGIPLETPLMFSRTSSIQSLSSVDNKQVQNTNDNNNNSNSGHPENGVMDGSNHTPSDSGDDEDRDVDRHVTTSNIIPGDHDDLDSVNGHQDDHNQLINDDEEDEDDDVAAQMLQSCIALGKTKQQQPIQIQPSIMNHNVPHVPPVINHDPMHHEMMGQNLNAYDDDQDDPDIPPEELIILPPPPLFSDDDPSSSISDKQQTYTIESCHPHHHNPNGYHPLYHQTNCSADADTSDDDEDVDLDLLSDAIYAGLPRKKVSDAKTGSRSTGIKSYVRAAVGATSASAASTDANMRSNGPGDHRRHAHKTSNRGHETKGGNIKSHHAQHHHQINPHHHHVAHHVPHVSHVPPPIPPKNKELSCVILKKEAKKVSDNLLIKSIVDYSDSSISELDKVEPPTVFNLMTASLVSTASNPSLMIMSGDVKVNDANGQSTPHHVYNDDVVKHHAPTDIIKSGSIVDAVIDYPSCAVVSVDKKPAVPPRNVSLSKPPTPKRRLHAPGLTTQPQLINKNVMAKSVEGIMIESTNAPSAMDDVSGVQTPKDKLIDSGNTDNHQHEVVQKRQSAPVAATRHNKYLVSTTTNEPKEMIMDHNMRQQDGINPDLILNHRMQQSNQNNHNHHPMLRQTMNKSMESSKDSLSSFSSDIFDQTDGSPLKQKLLSSQNVPPDVHSIREKISGIQLTDDEKKRCQSFLETDIDSIINYERFLEHQNSKYNTMAHGTSSSSGFDQKTGYQDTTGFHASSYQKQMDHQMVMPGISLSDVMISVEVPVAKKSSQNDNTKSNLLHVTNGGTQTTGGYDPTKSDDDEDSVVENKTYSINSPLKKMPKPGIIRPVINPRISRTLGASAASSSSVSRGALGNSRGTLGSSKNSVESSSTSKLVAPVASLRSSFRKKFGKFFSTPSTAPNTKS